MGHGARHCRNHISRKWYHMEIEGHLAYCRYIIAHSRMDITAVCRCYLHNFTVRLINSERCHKKGEISFIGYMLDLGKSWILEQMQYIQYALILIRKVK